MLAGINSGLWELKQLRTMDMMHLGQLIESEENRIQVLSEEVQGSPAMQTAMLELMRRKTAVEALKRAGNA